MLDSVCMLDKALLLQTVRYLNQVIGGEAVRVASSARTAELTYFLQETYDVLTGELLGHPWHFSDHWRGRWRQRWRR